METRKARIAQVITKLELGGAQLSTLELCRLLKLSPRGYEVTLVCGGGGILDVQAKRYGTFKIHFIRSLVRCIRPLKDLFALVSLYRFFKKNNFDIVHTHSSKAGVLGRIAAHFAQVPAVVHTVHGFSFYEGQNFFVKAFYKWLERVVSAFTGTYIVVCRSDIEKGVKAGIGGSDKFVLVRDFFDIENGSRLEKNDWKKSLGIVQRCEGKKVVLNVSCFKPQKNLTAFVELARVVCARKPECVFVLIGDGAGRGELEALVKKYGLEDRFFMPGWINDLERIYDIADVFVLTSVFEGLPIALAQAAARGVSCVVAGVDGVPELIEHTADGVCVDPFDVKGFESSVLYALEKKAKVGKECRGVKNLFDEQKNLLTLESVYAQLLVFSPPQDML